MAPKVLALRLLGFLGGCLGFAVSFPVLKEDSASARPLSQVADKSAIKVFEINKTFELPLGKTAHLKQSDVFITWTSLPQDSRCPQDARCVWAGEVRVKLRIKKQAFSESLELTLPGKSHRDTHPKIGKYTLTLMDVLPYPGSKEQDRIPRVRLRLSSP